MAKKRQFDEVEVLGIMAKYFWQHGYASTKVDQLSIVTGLTKTSIYNAFGNKEAVFKCIVDFYVEHHMSVILKRLDTDKSISENLQYLFDSELLNPENELLTYGCLMTNSIVELNSNEPYLYDYVVGKFEQGRIAVLAFFTQYEKTERLVDGIDAEHLTDFFLTFRQGLKVQSRGRRPHESLAQSIRAFMLVFSSFEK
ncbi:TetR/AcrR family transcriptional regulator [Agarivorans sp. DSG3-1]|uniref:TetR/AcrR family transcriptional regulator n=1 Tax=Agarivorans sp. DSG3-1 TaxID=3342249 RepID=UPI00398E4CA5